MGFDIALAIVFIIVGLVIGGIIAGLFFIFKLKSIENKARKSWKNQKGFFELKPNEKPVEVSVEKPSLLPKKKSIFNIFKKKEKENA
jgi:hypothetical protein